MKAHLLFLLLALAAASAPLWPAASRRETPSHENTSHDWPAGLVRDDWEPQALGEREARFARDFPGRIGVFSTAQGRTVIVREVTRPTRKLHPAADCLRALGYAMEPGPIQRDAQGRDWSTATATRDHRALGVRERIFNAAGQNWTDTSAWYWSAALGRARGPWWAVTELSPNSTAN